MKKQLEIFHSLVSEFQKDSTVEGILLNGSVAAGTATELSDLDMIVLGKKDGFVSKMIDTVLVEIHFVVFDSAVKKLESNPMEVYKYLDAKVEYDNGKAREIISYAENIFLNYRVPEKERLGLAYWLKSTK
ncbi:MAG: nucleotidyltransferase domain-containing protein, partial [Ruminiclostridium sp.]|nr:nucleotidyltransferase domain-containing protein [Ruminiclostridium sp.]